MAVHSSFRVIGLFSKAILLAAPVILVSQLSLADAAEEETTGSIQQELALTFQALKDITVEKKDQVVEKTESTLDKLDQRISELEKKLDKKYDEMDEAARAEAQESLKKLHESRAKLAEWMDQLKNGTASAWGNIKENISHSFKSLRESWSKAESDISKDDEVVKKSI